MIAASQEAGTVVVMTAGREQNQLYVIVGTTTEGYLLLADGRKRTVDKPKRKNIRHIRTVLARPAALQAAIQAQRAFRNEEIRAAITEAQRRNKGGSDEQGRRH